MPTNPMIISGKNEMTANVNSTPAKPLLFAAPAKLENAIKGVSSETTPQMIPIRRHMTRFVSSA